MKGKKVNQVIREMRVLKEKLDQQVLVWQLVELCFWSGSASNGYFLCDGSAKSRTTYDALYAVIGTTHGAGDGSTTFNLPDLSGRFVVGYDSNNNIFDVADKGGSADATLVAHGHTINDPGHFHTTVDYVARSGYADLETLV